MNVFAAFGSKASENKTSLLEGMKCKEHLSQVMMRRLGGVVRAARLWRRKSPYRVSSRLGFAMRRLENCLSTQQKMGTFFELGKDKAAKGEEWAPPFISYAQDTVGL